MPDHSTWSVTVVIINAVYHLRIRGGGGGEEGELKRGEAKEV